MDKYRDDVQKLFDRPRTEDASPREEAGYDQTCKTDAAKFWLGLSDRQRDDLKDAAKRDPISVFNFGWTCGVQFEKGRSGS